MTSGIIPDNDQRSYFDLYKPKSYGFWIDLCLKFVRTKRNYESDGNTLHVCEYKVFRGKFYYLNDYGVTSFEFGPIKLP